MMTERTLKPGWEIWRFEQMATNLVERVKPGDTTLDRYVGLEHLDSESLQVSRWGTPGDVIGEKLHFWPGDIIFGKRRVYQRKLAVADFEGICSAHAMVLRAKPDVVLPQLLPFFMQSDLFMNRALEISVGSLSPTINWRTLAEQEFPLPPIEEQRRIADLLWAMYEAIGSYTEVASSLECLWVATVADHFACANGEQEVTLGNLLKYASDGPFGSKLKTEHYKNNGIRVIRLQNIQENLFDNSDQAYISVDYYKKELQRYSVYPGDIMVAGLGDKSIRAGRACIIPDHLELAVNKADCYCLRTNTDLLPEYLVAFLNSPYGLRQSESFSQGTTRSRLNLGNIKRMKLFVPDVLTQKTFIKKLYSIEKGIKLQDQHIQAAKELMHELKNVALS